MSDLSVNVSSSGFIGLESEKVPAEAVNKKPEFDANKSIVDATQAKDAEAKAKQEKDQLAPVEVQEAVDEMSAFVQSMQRNLSFSIDEQLGEKIISVKDVESGEVIRQIPSEELVVLRKKMDDVVGLLFDTKV